MISNIHITILSQFKMLIFFAMIYNSLQGKEIRKFSKIEKIVNTNEHLVFLIDNNNNK
jgi:hypothetical protein